MKRNQRASWWGWKRRVKKTGLKLSIQKTNIMASCPITSWQIQGEKVEAVTDCIFFSSKITADSNFIYEIKKCLLFERKDMTKLDSILKSRDISLLKKVLTVKVVVFLIIKKTEHWRTDAFKSVVQKDSW